MRTLDPRIPLQDLLAQQLFNALQGGVVDRIRLCYQNDSSAYMHTNMRAHSLPVIAEVLPELHQLCMEVKEALGYEENIEFFVTGTSEVNARAIYSDDPENPHIIEINSGLFNLMSQDELKYVIGHEIGHLINYDGKLRKLFFYIYDDEESIENAPGFVTSRFELWSQLAELSADRYGYMACGNIDACITAIFKLASGLHLDKMNVRITDLMNLNNSNLDFFLQKSVPDCGSHPVNPIRVQALHLFVNAKTQKALNEGMDHLIGMLMPFFGDEIDDAFSLFTAAAGLYICLGDGKLEKREEEFILNSMAEFDLFPAKTLKRVAKSDYMEVMKQSLDRILNIDPSRSRQVLIYIIDLAFIDAVIEEEEVGRIIDLAKALGFTPEDLFAALTHKIRAHFRPQAYMM